MPKFNADVRISIPDIRLSKAAFSIWNFWRVKSFAAGNWQWRMAPGTDLTALSRWLLHITELYGRR